MRGIVCVFVFLAVVGIGLSRDLGKFVGKGGETQAATVDVSPRRIPEPQKSSGGGYRTVTLNDNGRGSFEVEARVEGRTIDFIVDTGASYVSLRESAAAKLGIHPTPRDYTIRTQTANGIGKAAPVMLDRVEINGITVRDVRAIVHPDDALAVNLLGMTFLSKVKWTHDRGRLVLEQ